MPSQSITSVSNPHIKKVLQLRERKARYECGLTIIEGVREVSCALAAGLKPQELFVCPEFFHDRGEAGLVGKIGKSATVFEVSKKVFEKISYGERHEGVLAVGQPQAVALHGLKLSSVPFVVIVESVEKPGNLGAILRTCDAAGVEALILCDPATDLYNPNIIRSSLGTIFSVPTVTASLEETKQFLNTNKIKICAAAPQAVQVYTGADLRGALAIVLGSEQKGLTDFWLKNSSLQVKIPMRGKADSLNVSNTAAILT